MNFRKLLWRVYCRLHPFPDDRSKEYWEAAAKINPFGTICTDATEDTFEGKFTLANLLHFTKDMTVLDLGCGLGRAAPIVAPQVRQYIGVDFSKTMIQKAKKRLSALSNVVLMVNDGWTLDLPNNSLDAAYCELLFQHISRENTLGYVIEVHRVLKPTGIFLAMIPRLDFYKNSAYALTREQTMYFFVGFDQVELLDEKLWKAYYIVRAVK